MVELLSIGCFRFAKRQIYVKPITSHILMQAPARVKPRGAGETALRRL